jgi:molybdenum cofactor cytidylyltransferase
MISAIILAAGESKRMGQPKMLLPWGKVSVLQHVISTFQGAGIEDIIVVTGGAHEPVEETVKQSGARSVFNRNYANGEMLSSLQCGLEVLFHADAAAMATLICLGDQPQIQTGSVHLICETFRERKPRLIVPSFQRRRGHPWLVERSLWTELLEMRSPQSPRDFLNKHADEIHYVEVSAPSILADLDTPEDYQSSRPESE